MTYHTSNEEHPIDIVNIASLEGRVKERMESGAFGYIRGGSEDEWTMKENTTSFNTKKSCHGYYAESTQPICIHLFSELN